MKSRNYIFFHDIRYLDRSICRIPDKGVPNSIQMHFHRKSESLTPCSLSGSFPDIHVFALPPGLSAYLDRWERRFALQDSRGRVRTKHHLHVHEPDRDMYLPTHQQSARQETGFQPGEQVPVAQTWKRQQAGTSDTGIWDPSHEPYLHTLL